MYYIFNFMVINTIILLPLRCCITLGLTLNTAEIWRQVGDKTDHDILCRRSFFIPWKIALRVLMLLFLCRRVLHFVVIWHSILFYVIVINEIWMCNSSLRRTSPNERAMNAIQHLKYSSINSHYSDKPNSLFPILIHKTVVSVWKNF